MTAEIALLNRSAVALAADSAVTINTPTGPKIYDSVNKLFALVKQRPVGVMIYDSADLIGMPWETAIKAYRMHHRGDPFDHLDEYADDFLGFLTATPELLPVELHDLYFEEAIIRRLLCLRDLINRSVERLLKSGGKLGQKRLRELIDASIDEEEARWNGQPDGGWGATIDVKRLEQAKRGRIDVLLGDVLQQLPVVARQRRRIRELVVGSLTKVPYWHPRRGPVDPRSGLVITGFGEREFFPRLLSFDISGVIDGRLRIVPRTDQSIGADNSAIIAPFAQREMVDSFVTGINPQLQEGMRSYWRGMERSFPDGVLTLLKQQAALDDATANALTGPIRSLVLAALRELEDFLDDMQGQQVAPILNSVTYLPKDELAAMAESLVNLTSLKRRVSIDDPQTVGGPVDVAVISRGDGFVWIKRKHYFAQELNPSWAMTHADA